MSAQTQFATKTDTDIKYPNRYNVLLINDDYTPMEFVIQLLIEIFNQNLDQAKDIMVNVHEHGKGIAGMYGLEIAEQKQHEATVVSRHHGHPLKVVVEKID
jgi:ATP-dependent Clp protease adaptor protein ClpS|tara:strand:- start:7371 stop:7673 length:303 start_codon:yes stop_codon:yes gene_type:complete